MQIKPQEISQGTKCAEICLPIHIGPCGYNPVLSCKTLYGKLSLSFYIFFQIKNPVLSMKERASKVLDVDSIISRLYCHNPSPMTSFPLLLQEIQALCRSATTILISQPMLLELQPPVIICGDVHGQFRDLVNIFKRVGKPGDRNYLFLGDYVDRGRCSLECYCLLLAFKVKHPSNFFLLRGNHESPTLNKIYGFYEECKRKFNHQLFKTVSDTFNYLPAAAVVGGRLFCVHGGLSPSLKNLEEINSIKRPIDNAKNNLLQDLLWSDPDRKGDGFSANYERGVSYLYGKQALEDFLQKYDFDILVRSHQVVEEGYEFQFNRRLVTIFSAPNYCGEFNNFGGVLKVTCDLICSMEQFKGQLMTFDRVQRSSTPLRVSSPGIGSNSPSPSKKLRHNSHIQSPTPRSSAFKPKQNSAPAPISKLDKYLKSV